MNDSESLHDFQELFTRIQNGDEDACREMVERHGASLKHIVRRHLNRRVRSVFDSDDLAQDVWKSWFRALGDGSGLPGPEQLLVFLQGIARNKTLQVNRSHLDTEKRDLRRAEPLDGLCAAEQAQPPTCEADPLEVAIGQDLWEWLLRDAPPLLQTILTHLRASYTQQEIAKATGLNERTIRRLLAKLRLELVTNEN